MKFSNILDELTNSPQNSEQDLQSAQLSDAGGDTELDIDDGETLSDTDSGEVPSTSDRDGEIRVVPRAHLVYKRKQDANKFTELWIYKHDNLAKQSDLVYAAILAATDIPVRAKSSPDGEQTVKTWRIGKPTDTLVFVELNGLTS